MIETTTGTTGTTVATVTTEAATSEPASPASSGHSHVDDDAFIARVRRTQARDATILRALRKLSPFAVVILVVVGVLSVAIPNFIVFNCRALTAEGKLNLKALVVAERALFAERDRFSLDVGELGWTAKGVRQRYSYYVAKDDARGSLHALAIGTGRLAGDVWHVDFDRARDGELEHLAEACR